MKYFSILMILTFFVARSGAALAGDDVIVFPPESVTECLTVYQLSGTSAVAQR